jgi:tRNA-binding EMAP/Myf-like protein
MDSGIQAYCSALKDLVGGEDPLTILSDTPARIRSLITGIDAAVLRHKPHPGKWSIAEIVAHLADSELVFGYRLRMVFTVNGTHLQAFDPDAFASAFHYESCDAHTSAELFAAMRTGNLRMLRQVAEPVLDNAGVHEEWGTETGRNLIRLEAGHDKNHLAQIERLRDTVGRAPAFRPREQKPAVSLDAADKVDLRVGTIVDIVPIPGANRLMKLTVDFGSDKRTVIAGIREERSDPRVVVGRQALFYYNLPRKEIRGHLSEAMLCDVGHADGILPALLQPEWPVPNGARAG